MPLSRIPKVGEKLLFNPGRRSIYFKNKFVVARVYHVYEAEKAIGVFVSNEETSEINGFINGVPESSWTGFFDCFEEYSAGDGDRDEEL